MVRTFSIVCVLATTSAVLGCAGAPPTNSEPAAHGHEDAHGRGRGPEPSNAPACRLLATTCHAHDKESDKAHSCHVLGHTASSNDECEAKRTECMAVCGTDGGT